MFKRYVSITVGFILTVVNFLGFLMIGPFTLFTIFIGLPAGFIAVIYMGQQSLAFANSTTVRIPVGFLCIANVYILYLSMNLLNFFSPVR